VVYIVVFTVKTYSGSFHSVQTICCFFPPMALQIASGAFQNSYTGISTSTIGGIMVLYFFLSECFCMVIYYCNSLQTFLSIVSWRGIFLKFGLLLLEYLNHSTLLLWFEVDFFLDIF